MTPETVVIDGISTAGGIGLFLLGAVIGFLVGWVLGVFQTHAEHGIPLSDEEKVTGQPSIVLPDTPGAGPTPKAEG